MRYFLLYITLAALIIPVAVCAQDVTVALSLDRSELTVSDRLKMTITVSGAMRSVPDPQIENLQGFSMVGSSQSTRFSFTNGRISSSKSTEYTLLPSREGTFTLGPAVVEIKGQTYRSSTMEVKVVGASGGVTSAPQPGQQAQPATPQQPQKKIAGPAQSASTPNREVFILGNTDKQAVYLGQQLIYTFGFYSRSNLRQNPNYSPATFTGFWVEELDKSARRLQRSVNGVPYSVQELRYALFPTISGEAVISPSQLAVSIGNSWDFFGRGRSYNLQTPELKIKVKPLPVSGKPANFSGAVGKFGISARLDKNQVRQGEAITLVVVVSGNGNLKNVAEPVLPEMDGFDIYESKSEEKIDRSDAGISGRKIFSYVIVPRKTGEVKWPGIPFVFFDPQTEKYVSIATSALSFTVLPGKEEEKAPAYRLPGREVLALGEDIRYIKENPSALRPAPGAFSEFGLFWLLHLVPLVCLGAGLLYRRHQGRLMSDTAYARLRGSRKRLGRSLKQTARELSSGNIAECYAGLDRALVHFIGDKLNLETTGMVAEQIIELLAGRGLSGNTVQEVADCLEHFAMVRFTPRAGDRDDAREYLKKVRKLTESLDRSL
jgi:BatD DUF11 like domain